MPTLNWIGKDKVANHHLDVPFRVLEHLYTFGEPDSGNMIIHGDNLDALKSLMPRYEGRVKCIYIDPPYNTGNEGWVYNDNVNDPKIKKWLGKVVGSEGEDLSRHDKWLCMMYPRLRLLQKLLAEDGAIFISIDDNEQANLRLICDEIFGTNNFLANISWEKRYTRSNNAKLFYSLKDTIIAYRKSPTLSIIKESRTAKADSHYTNQDNDPRGDWATSSYVNPATKEKRKNLVYTILAPDGREINHPTHAWKYSYEEHERHVNENLLWWGLNNDAQYPRLKLFVSEASGMVPVDIWDYKTTGTTDEGGQEIKNIFGSLVFDTPKPTKLIERMLKMLCSDPESIILDSFAGSGTTAHAVLNMNKTDGGNRRFILVEMEDYCERITAERVRHVINGYGEGKNAAEGTGGGFDYYELGQPLMFANGSLNEAVDTAKTREYVWYMETKLPMQAVDLTANPYLLGVISSQPSSTDTTDGQWPPLQGGTAYYFHYENDSATTLDTAFLASITIKAERYIIYADQCALSDNILDRYNITFKKIPRDIARM